MLFFGLLSIVIFMYDMWLLGVVYNLFHKSMSSRFQRFCLSRLEFVDFQHLFDKAYAISIGIFTDW